MLILLAVCHCGLTAAHAQVVGPDVQVTSRVGVEAEPSVAAFGDRLVAVWYRDEFVRKSGWGYSLDGGATWVDGGAFGTGEMTHGQPTLCVDNTGRFYAATYSGSTANTSIVVYRGTFQGNSLLWEAPRIAIPATPTGIMPAAFDAPRLTSDPERGYLYLTYTRTFSSAFPDYQYTIHVVRSLDGGLTWSVPLTLSGDACNGSRPVVGPDGELYVLWEDFAAGQVLGRRSADFGTSFGAPFVVGDMHDNLGTVPFGWLDPVWRLNPLYPIGGITRASDFPAVAVDRSPGPNRGRLYAAWTDHVTGAVPPASGLGYEVEPNDFFPQATQIVPGQDVEGYAYGEEYCGVQDCDTFVFEGTAGTTIWLTGRLLSLFPSPPPDQLYTYGFTLYCEDPAVGRHRVARELLNVGPYAAPPVIYTLPVSGRYYIGMDCPQVSCYEYRVSLRELQPDGSGVARDHRDVVLTSSSDGGATWSAKRQVGDAPAGRDEYLPTLAVDDLGRVHLVWYDRRDDPDCGRVANTYWSFSTDGGVSFAAARRLSGQGGIWFIPSGGSGDFSNVGDHLGIAAGGGRVTVLWADHRGGGVNIRAATVSDVPTAVTIARFVADLADRQVTMRWTVLNAEGITGFRVHRAEGDERAHTPLEDLASPSRGAGEYEAEDRPARAGRYRYWLEVVRGTGASEWHGPAEVTLLPLIGRLAWQASGPNPFRGTIRLELAVRRAGEGWVRIYDVTGHEVATLHRGALAAGVTGFVWDGRGTAGQRVAAGVYVARADAGGEHVTRRLVRIQ